MPPFPKPRFVYDYDLDRELAAIRAYRRDKPGRQIPKKAGDRLLLATWNIANIGVQGRLESDYVLIAEMTCAGSRRSTRSSRRATTCSSPTGPAIRSGRRFSTTRGRSRDSGRWGGSRFRLVTWRRSSSPAQRPRSRASTAALASFACGSFRFSLLNVHLFYGSPKPADVDRRTLETFAVAWWADRKHRDARSYVPEIVPLGDFNLPKPAPDDRIYAALISLGLEVPPHTSQIGSAIASDSYYDQIAFLPGTTKTRFTGASNVFDFDGALFADLWQQRPGSPFLSYARYHMSDHRPLWAEFNTA